MTASDSRVDYYVIVADSKSVARFLNDLRNRQEVSQHELAEALGTRQSAVCDMLSGFHDPQFNTVSRLAAALGYRLALVPFTAEDHYLAEKVADAS